MPAYRHLVSLGSSMAAGPGIAPIVDRAAMRSGRNYPHLLAERLGARLTDLTISGATTKTVLSEHQRTLLGPRRTPQLDGFPDDADLVTITIGGNDLRYVGGLMFAPMAGLVSRFPLGGIPASFVDTHTGSRTTDADLDAVLDGIVRIVDTVRARSSAEPRVVLVDYLTLIGPDTAPSRETPLRRKQLDRYRAVGLALDAVYVRAAERTGADLLKASELSVDHAIGSADPWVVGVGRNGGIPPYHPNPAGMQAVADALADLLGA